MLDNEVLMYRQWRHFSSPLGKPGRERYGLEREKKLQPTKVCKGQGILKKFSGH